MSSETPPRTNLSLTPAGISPSGVLPNFVDPPSLSTTTLAVLVTSLSLITIVVGIRLYSNYTSIRKLGWDDLSCVVATILSYVDAGAIISVRQYTRHSWDIPLSWLNSSFLKKLYVVEMVVGPALFFAKFSLLLLYFRIFALEKRARYSIYFAMAFSFPLYWLSVVIDSYYNAPHIGEEWSEAIIAERGVASSIWGVVQGALNVLLDMFILMIPIPVILRLHLPAKKKAGTCVVFLTGFIATVASIISLVYRTKTLRPADDPDSSWHVGIVNLAIATEVNCSILCGSLPSLASFYKDTIRQNACFSSLISYLSFRRNTPGSEGRSKNLAGPFVSARRDQAASQYPEAHTNLNGGTYRELFESYAWSEHDMKDLGSLSRGNSQRQKPSTKNAISKSITVEQTTGIASMV